MRHTGEQLFKDIDVSNDAKINKANIIDKLSIPIRRSVDKNEFSDMFIELNQSNYVNYYNDIIGIADLVNDDILKSLLLSEIMFDDFFNFSKTLNESESFHTLIDVNGLNFTQIELNKTMSCSTDWDATSLPTVKLNFTDISEMDAVFLGLTTSNQNKLPLNTTFEDSTSDVYNHMVQYDHILYDSVNMQILVYLDSTSNTLILNDLTNVGIITVTIDAYTIQNKLTLNNYIDLPNHYHVLNDIHDLDDNVNKPNGFQRFINNNEIKFDFDQFLNVHKFRIKDSFFEKDQYNSLAKKTIFDIQMVNVSHTENLNYTIKEIDLGGGNTLYEYHFQNFEVNSVDNIVVNTIDNQEISVQKDYSINDTTQHETQYLVEILKFDYNLIIDPINTDKNNIVDVYYEQADKTSIDNLEIEIYKNVDQTIYTINSYYDISIIQPNLNTIPYVNIVKILLCKDSDNKVLINVPKIYKNNSETLDISLQHDSDMYIKFDTSSIPITVEAYKLDICINKWEYIDTYDLTSENERLTLPRGRIKLEPSNNLNKYKITLFDRTQ